MSTKQKTPITRSPIDRLIRLLAEVEVERYTNEIIKKELREGHGQEEGGDLRTL